MNIKHTIYIIPILIFSAILWILWGTPSVKKGLHYSITDKNLHYTFVVTDIKSEESDNYLTESIEYKLYQKGTEEKGTKTSLIRYRVHRRGDYTQDIVRIDGTDQIVIGSNKFTWSYKSENQIYIYLEDGLKLRKVENV